MLARHGPRMQWPRPLTGATDGETPRKGRDRRRRLSGRWPSGGYHDVSRVGHTPRFLLCPANSHRMVARQALPSYAGSPGLDWVCLWESWPQG